MTGSEREKTGTKYHVMAELRQWGRQVGRRKLDTQLCQRMPQLLKLDGYLDQLLLAGRVSRSLRQ